MLRHHAFFSSLNEPSSSASSDEILAGLMVLRIVDHWFDFGLQGTGPDSAAGTATREFLSSSHIPAETRDMLRQILNTVQSSPETDIEIAVPRLFAYAVFLQGRGAYSLAADVLATVIEYTNIEAADPMLVDAWLQVASCQMRLAKFADAEAAYRSAEELASAAHDRPRMLHAKIGAAIVVRRRGNLPRADELFESLDLECELLGAPNILAGALHEHAIVAQQLGDLDRAVCLADRARLTTTSDEHRARICGDLGAFFVAMGWFDAARDALLISESVASAPIMRTRARVNLLSVAARLGDRESILHFRAVLEGEAMYPELRANYLIESARGAICLGDVKDGTKRLVAARKLAEDHDLNRAAFEADAMLNELGRTTPLPMPRARLPIAAVNVVESLRRTADELVSRSASPM